MRSDEGMTAEGTLRVKIAPFIEGKREGFGDSAIVASLTIGDIRGFLEEVKQERLLVEQRVADGEKIGEQRGMRKMAEAGAKHVEDCEQRRPKWDKSTWTPEQVGELLIGLAKNLRGLPNKLGIDLSAAPREGAGT